MLRINRETTNCRKSSFCKIYVFWLFISVLPQFMRLSRGDTLGYVIKAASIIIMVSWVSVISATARKGTVTRNTFVQLIVLVTTLAFSNFVVNDGFNIDTYIGVACTIFYFYVFMCKFSSVSISRKELIKIASLVEVMVLYTCVMNVVIYGNQMLPLLSTLDADTYNISSVFFNRTNYASFLTIGIIFITIRLRCDNTGKARHMFLLAIAMVNLLFTLARTSIFTVVAYYFILFILDRRKTGGSKIITVIVGVVIVLCILTATGAGEFIIKMVIRPQAGLTYRNLIWEKINLDLRNANIGQLLFGFGMSYHIEAHNTVIGTMTKMGAVGSLLYLAIYINTIRHIATIWKANRDEAVYFIAIFIAFIATSFTEEFTPFMSTSMSVIWTFTAILLPRYYSNYQRSLISNV